MPEQWRFCKQSGDLLQGKGTRFGTFLSLRACTVNMQLSNTSAN
jgi:hypothetical protein